MSDDVRDERAQRVAKAISQLRFESTHFKGTTMTLTVAIMPNGFVVGKGDYAFIDPEIFDAGAGIEYSKENALVDAQDNLWQMLAFIDKGGFS